MSSTVKIKGISITIEKKHEPHLAYSHYVCVYVQHSMSINSMNKAGGSVINIFLDQLDPMDLIRLFLCAIFQLNEGFCQPTSWNALITLV